MSVRRVLREALATVQRAHCAPARGLAQTAGGERCEPLSPAATAWTSIGAIILADPVRRQPAARDTHGDHAWHAYLLLVQAAREQGYPGPIAVDQAGVSAVTRLFWRALQLAPSEKKGARPGSRATRVRSTNFPRDAA